MVTLAAVIAIFLAAWRINPDEHPYEFMAALIIIVGILSIIAYRKGERPKWSWGR